MIEIIQNFITFFYDVQGLIRLAGYAGLFAIVFAETGLFFGFFLPGDSLLITAGLFAARGDLDIAMLILLLIPAAVIGDAVGYSFGRKVGPPLFKRRHSVLFHPEHLMAAKEFYEKHGGKTIVLARFVPFIRTFAPIVAGVAGMRYRDFAVFNIAGGALWVCTTLLIGYLLGNIPGVAENIHVAILLIIAASFIPIVYEFARRERGRKKR